MAENVHEQLLGYLLDALEDDERQALQEELSRDEQLRRQLTSLREMIQPLESTRDAAEPPPRLAERTCRLVAEKAREAAGSIEDHPVPAARLHELGEDVTFGGDSSRFSWLDLVTGAGIVIAASLLIFPALQVSRHEARKAECAYHLQLLYQGLEQYAEAFAGYLPAAPPHDRLAVGGGFGPTMRSQGYLPDPRVLLCPDSLLAKAGDFSLPEVEEIRSMSEGPALRRQLADLGSYSMSFGQEDDGRYVGLRNDKGPTFALISDTPSRRAPDFLSPNHGDGENILFGDGRVHFTKGPYATPGGDHMFLNRDSQVGLGLSPSDSVIGPSGQLPIVHLRRR